jgi:glycolate oxidase iron-sulfur subunit
MSFSSSTAQTQNDLYHSCIHCGLCLETCPTYQVTQLESHSPRGRITAIEAVCEGHLNLSQPIYNSLDSCLGCRACETACPSDVEYGKLLEWFKAKHLEPNRPLSKRKLLSRTLVRHILPNAKLNQLAVKVATPFKSTQLHPWLALLPAKQTTKKHPQANIIQTTDSLKPQVALMTGCSSDAFCPELNQAAIFLIHLAGYQVVIPQTQVC